MKIKPEASLTDFLREVDQCESAVFFETTEGDILNLKSQLSKYIFLAAAASPKNSFLPIGHVVCDMKEDFQRLKTFLIAES